MGMTGKRTHTLAISGDAGLRSGQTLLQQLHDAVTTHKTVVISVEAITSADITTIQLLLAARKLAADSGQALTLAAPPSGPFRDALIQFGLLDSAGRALTADGDFWTSTTPATGKAA